MQPNNTETIQYLIANGAQLTALDDVSYIRNTQTRKQTNKQSTRFVTNKEINIFLIDFLLFLYL